MMCLAVPAQIEKIDEKKGTVALDGNRTDVLLTLVPEAVVGDWCWSTPAMRSLCWTRSRPRKRTTC